MRRIYCSTMAKTITLIFLTILFVFIMRCISIRGDRTILKTIEEAINYESESTISKSGVLEINKFTSENIIFKQVEPERYNKQYENIEPTQEILKMSRSKFDKAPIFHKNPMKNQVFLQHKIVHLDLKGAPPKIEYLLRILPLMKSAGATGILIEYEDMFPFEGALQNISALNGYSKTEVGFFQFNIIQIIITAIRFAYKNLKNKL